MVRLAGAAILASLLVTAHAPAAGSQASRNDGPPAAKWCPKGERDGLRVARLDQRRVRVARRMARRHECSLRIVKLNGVFLAITSDLRRDRVNVHVRDGRVIRVSGVY